MEDAPLMMTYARRPQGPCEARVAFERKASISGGGSDEKTAIQFRFGYPDSQRHADRKKCAERAEAHGSRTCSET
jgi:hypothetical protein